MHEMHKIDIVSIDVGESVVAEFSVAESGVTESVRPNPSGDVIGYLVRCWRLCALCSLGGRVFPAWWGHASPLMRIGTCSLLVRERERERGRINNIFSFFFLSFPLLFWGFDFWVFLNIFVLFFLF